jgi:hypothetical protein
MLHATTTSHTIRVLESISMSNRYNTISKRVSEIKRCRGRTLLPCSFTAPCEKASLIRDYIRGTFYPRPDLRKSLKSAAYSSRIRNSRRPFLRPFFALNCSGSFSESLARYNSWRACVRVPQKYSIGAIHLQIE